MAEPISLQEIMKLQLSFDQRHSNKDEIETSWGDKVSQSNVHLLEHSLVCLVGEIGEFANVLKKVVRGDVSYENATPLLQEEITDAFIYLIKICNQMEIDLPASYRERLRLNEARFRVFEK